MLQVIDSKRMGTSDLGWLKSLFHFSFADYYNPDNMSFGVLRVINDDLVYPQTGFDTHPHKDMEIISYVVDGELTHGDNMGNISTIKRGHVQYMSAGTGVYHSEHNMGDEIARFLQIWIIPDGKGYKPNYGEFRFDWDERVNKWLHMVSGVQGNAPIKINQDVDISALYLEAGKAADYHLEVGQQAYLVQMEGTSTINGLAMNPKDALEIMDESIHINASTPSHYLVIRV